MNRNERPLSERLAIDRTLLANERTLLSYVRTALALAASGVGLAEIFDSLLTDVIGWTLVPVGVLTGLWGLWKHKRTARRIRETDAIGS